MISVLETKVVVARKEHKCSWCDKRIAVGERYTVSSIASEETIYSWRGCKRCEEFVDKAYKELDSWGDGVTQEEFLEYMREEHKEVYYRWKLEDGLANIENEEGDTFDGGFDRG
jgi:hypothetical protein